MSLMLVKECSSPDQSAGLPDRSRRTVAFTFEDQIEGVVDPVASVSPLQQENFCCLFFGEMDALDRWADRAGWQLPSPFPRLDVRVSRQYRFAQSLWPQWKGESGRMAFPAYRVAVGEANVMHELVHVYFPNGNRMLAEGLAVHLQQDIGRNRCFPNFGEDLHGLLVHGLEAELQKTVEDIHLETLEQISTPSMLMLRLGRTTIKGAWPYVIAGSFVRFLIETRGMERLRALYMMTPLVPLARDSGAPERWNAVYGGSFADITREWKAGISSRAGRR